MVKLNPVVRLIKLSMNALATSAQNRGFEGTILAVSLHDLVQMECLAMTTRAVRVDRGDISGRIYFAGGQVVHAEIGEMAGEDAFIEIMTWQNGSFRIEEGMRSMDNTITRHWEGLLMEAAHKFDELGAVTIASFPMKENIMNQDPIATALSDAEVITAAKFSNDGDTLFARGDEAEILQGTFSYVIQLLQHVGTALGSDRVVEIHVTGPDRKAVCVVGPENTVAAVTTPKVNLSTLAKKLS